MKLDPKSVEDHLLLGRLYRLNNELLKSESEFKTAVKIQPDSEEAVTTLAYLYNEEGDSNHALQVLNADPGERAHRQAVFRAGLHLRAAEGLQEGDRRLSQLHRTRPRQSGFGARPGPEPDERRPDRRRAGAVQNRSPTPIPRTRRPTCASPKSIAATGKFDQAWKR